MVQDRFGEACGNAHFPPPPLEDGAIIHPQILWFTAGWALLAVVLADGWELTLEAASFCWREEVKVIGYPSHTPEGRRILGFGVLFCVLTFNATWNFLDNLEGSVDLVKFVFVGFL